MKKIPVIIVIVGPTASGKTALGVQLALKYNAEIVSADSMQIYKGMPIATAVPRAEEKQGVIHHLIEFAYPNQRFSVAEYVALARQKIDDIISSGKNVIIVGGTGLYIDCLLKNTKFSDEESTGVREMFNDIAKKNGIESLYRELAEKDPEYAATIHRNDKKRIVRALEVMETHKKTVTEMNRLSRKEEFPYEVLKIGINFQNRELLYDRINRRVDNMIEEGLLDEARKAKSYGKDTTAAQAIGHKEFFGYFDGTEDLSSAVERLKANTRHYAKRQLTWFRRDEDIHWIYADEGNVFEKAVQIIQNESRQKE